MSRYLPPTDLFLGRLSFGGGCCVLAGGLLFFVFLHIFFPNKWLSPIIPKHHPKYEQEARSRQEQREEEQREPKPEQREQEARESKQEQLMKDVVLL